MLLAISKEVPGSCHDFDVFAGWDVRGGPIKTSFLCKIRKIKIPDLKKSRQQDLRSKLFYFFMFEIVYLCIKNDCHDEVMLQARNRGKNSFLCKQSSFL